MKPSAKKHLQAGQADQDSVKLLAPLLALYQSGQLQLAQQQAEQLVAQYPAFGMAWKILGSVYQQQGLLSEAAYAFEQASTTLSKDAEVFYNWGNVCFQQQLLTQAQALYEKAIVIQPKFSQAHANLACVFNDQGQSKRAEKAFNQALRLQPKDSFVLSSLALLLHQAGKPKEAMQYYRRAHALTPNDASLLFNMAQAFEDIGDFAQAEKSYKDAIDLKPDYADAIFNLGLYFYQLADYANAETMYLKGLALEPLSERFLENLSKVYSALGRFKETQYYFHKAIEINPSALKLNAMVASLINMGLFQEAENYCLDALGLDDANADIYCNLGLIQQAKKDHAQACASFEKALSLNSESAIILSNYAVTLRAMGRLSDAQGCLEQAIALQSDFTNAYINLSNIYLDKGEITKSIETLYKILLLEPEHTQAMQNLLMHDSYINHLGADAYLDLAKKFGQLLSKDIEQFSAWKLHPLDNRLRVGLLSGDFRNHPVCFFILNWLKNNNPKKIEVYAYAADAREDQYTAEVKALCSQWRCLAGKTDKEAAELMHDDGLHVLIDLSGHTAGSRLPIMAHKPAPVQVEWLGYWSTIGLPTIDYFIADPVSLPATLESNFSEKIAYLPHTRLCYSPLENAPDVNQLPALKNTFVTFGCFQNYTKVNAEVIKLWAKVMHALPESVMRWHCKAFNDAGMRTLALKRLEAEGIQSERIQLIGEVARLSYLQAHHEVDFILDTFPFTGGTTTCDALWMGVPTLTLISETLIGRQGASLNHAAGLSDWVVTSPDDYVTKAVHWATHLDDLAKLRQQLRQQVLNSPLMQGAQFAQDFEKLLFALWREHLTQAPVHSCQAHQPTQSFYEGNQPIWVVSATRMDEATFWQESALGRSLHRHMQQDQRLYPHIFYNNTRGLSELFNEAIEVAPDNAIFVFIHDDVWLDQNTFTHQLLQGLSQYDVIGLAGNKRRLPAQPGWLFVNTEFEWDNEEFTAGTVAHGQDAFGEPSEFGASPTGCELMDGVFLAASKQSLLKHQVRFDPQFKFHFYDLDFCRTARDAGLQLGVWPIAITHQSPGAFSSESWKKTYLQYLDKWQETAFFEQAGAFMNTLAITEQKTQSADVTQALMGTIQEVMAEAATFADAGDVAQAQLMYQEVLNVVPQYAPALHGLGQLYCLAGQDEQGLLYLEQAVMAEPTQAAYWLEYIECLMQHASVDEVLQAIELGQQHGLRPEVAAKLKQQWLEQQASTNQAKQSQTVIANSLSEEPTELYQQASDLEAQGHMKAAIDHYQQLLKIDPKHALALHAVGRLLAETDSIEVALPYLESALTQAPQVEQHWVTYIDALIQLQAFKTVFYAIAEGQKYALSATMHDILFEDAVNYAIGLLDEESLDQPLLLSALIEDTGVLAKVVQANITTVQQGLASGKTLDGHMDLTHFTQFMQRFSGLQTPANCMAIIRFLVSKLMWVPELIGHKIFAPALDSILSRIDLEINTVMPRIGKVSNIVIATEIYDSGGHTKEIISILNNVEQPMLIITDLYGRFASQGFYQKVAQALPDCPVLVLPAESLLQKSRRLAHLLNSHARNVFLLTHHDDVVATVACQANLDAHYYFIHHADHNLAIGNTIPHLLHVDLFEQRAHNCHHDTQLETAFLPTTAKDQGVKTFSINNGRLSTVTAGSIGKFNTGGYLALANIISQCLGVGDGEHYHFGEIPVQILHQIRTHLMQQGLSTNRFIYKGNVPSLWQALLEIDAHVFIGSAPIMGAKSDIEAQGAGYPLLAYKALDCPRHLNVGSHAPETIYWHDMESFKAGLKTIQSHHAHYSQLARQYYEQACSIKAYRQALQQMSV